MELLVKIYVKLPLILVKTLPEDNLYCDHKPRIYQSEQISPSLLRIGTITVCLAGCVRSMLLVRP